jgi:hypothetical protein
MILNPEKISNTAKATGIDPKIVVKNLAVSGLSKFVHQNE